LLFFSLGPCSLPAQMSQSNQAQPQSQDEIAAVPNRPTFATTAEVVQRGVFEIEYGLEAAQGHQNINGLLKFGLFKNLELRFANNPIERNSGIAGTGDSAAGFKWRFVSQRKQVPTLSLLYTATLPTAANNLGAGDFGQSVQLLVSKDFGKHHFDFNEGVQLRGRPGVGGFDRNYFTSLSWSHPLGEKQRWGLTAEIAGFSKTNGATPATLILLGAPTYNVSPRLVLDAGAYLAVYGHLPRVTFFAGVTYAVADLCHLAAGRKAAK